jgi:6-pyruvoyltetrahydropterin/6-carboxytetrahydropterin synthase
MNIPDSGYSSEVIRVTKVFSFEMAHALFNYDGPCKNIHGHSYVLEVTILGNPFLSKGHPKDGLVIDFSDLKKIVQKEIIDQMDHALVLNEYSPDKLTENLSAGYEKVIVFPFQPSCENLLIHFKNKLSGLFGGKCKLVALKLRETKGSWAEWFFQDNIPVT